MLSDFVAPQPIVLTRLEEDIGMDVCSILDQPRLECGDVLGFDRLHGLPRRLLLANSGLNALAGLPE